MRVPTLLPALVLALVTAGAAAPATGPAAEAKALVEQGRRLEQDGRPEVALGLYRAALLLAPDEPEPHRAVAELLHAKRDCEGAVPEYRTWLSLVPADARSGEAYEAGVVHLAECLAAARARLEIGAEASARCTVDGGAARQADATAPAVFDLSPGAHRLSCAPAGGPPFEVELALTAGETRALSIDATGRATGTLLASSALAAICVVDGGSSFTAAEPALPRRLKEGSHRLDCTAPGHPPFVGSVSITPGGLHELRLPFLRPEPAASPPADVVVASAPALPVVGPEGTTEGFALPPLEPAPAPALPPAAPAEPPEVPAEVLGTVIVPDEPSARPTVVPEAPPAPAKTTGELEVLTEGRGWTCTVGERFVAPDYSGEIFLEVAPGTYPIACEKVGAEPVSTSVTVAAGRREQVRIAWTPKAAPPPAPPKPKPLSLLPGPVEWMVGGGIGPSLGTFGVAGGGRFEAWSVLAGSGLYPFALTGTHHLNPGGSGAYVSVGWLRVGSGLLGGGSTVPGHGLWAGGGVEVRLEARAVVRLGAGLGWNSTGLQSGPLTFDLSVFWLP